MNTNLPFAETFTLHTKVVLQTVQDNFHQFWDDPHNFRTTHLLLVLQTCTFGTTLNSPFKIVLFWDDFG